EPRAGRAVPTPGPAFARRSGPRGSIPAAGPTPAYPRVERAAPPPAGIRRRTCTHSFTVRGGRAAWSERTASGSALGTGLHVAGGQNRGAGPWRSPTGSSGQIWVRLSVSGCARRSGKTTTYPDI